MRQRQARNLIFRLKNEIGIWEENPNEIKNILVAAFTKRFKSETVIGRNMDLISLSHQLKEEEIESLLAPITNEEIKQVVLNLNPHKVPGSDGFGPIFYQKYWHIIGNEICIAIRSFFDHGKLTPALNHTLVVLIPKINYPKNANHFRPISLVNTIYKIISKLIVNRMRLILQRIINPFQNAFTHNRSTHVNLLLVQEILNTFRTSKNKTGWCALKLNMEKAYDRIEWDFLWNVLGKFGFPSVWINWIKACVMTTSYSLVVNGESTISFKPSRELRQGDLLSPYLFLLCMEALSRKLIKKNEYSKNGVGISYAKNAIKIPVLFFADDCLIFCKASNSASTYIKSILEKLCTDSEQLINYHKSTIIFSKYVTVQKRNSLAAIFNMHAGISLGKYLGIQFGAFKPSQNVATDIISKTNNRLSNWGSKLLSKAGRFTLIQSNL